MTRTKLPMPHMNDNMVVPKNVVIEKTGEIYSKKSNTLYITEEIGGMFGVSADEISEAMLDLDDEKPLRVVINSPGGSVYEAILIHNMIADWPEEVTTHVPAIAASAATLLSMVGDKRTMADNAEYMIHNPYVIMAGNAKELRAMANKIDKTGEKILDMYDRVSTLSRDEIKDFLDGEEGFDGTYFTAHEALDAGFVDSIIDTSRKSKKPKEEDSIKSRLISARIKLSGVDIR